jgi:hypothetical protein
MQFQTRKISLKITSKGSSSISSSAGQESSARLLNRASFTAPVGLHLDLDLPGHEDVLAQLLRPALERPGGWPNVHKLKVGSLPFCTASLSGMRGELYDMRYNITCVLLLLAGAS